MKKILVIQTASIGDVILATALLEKLHHAFPDANLDFLVKKGMFPLFDRHPFLHAVLEWDKSRKNRDLVRLFRHVRREEYDLVINIQRFAMTGLLTAFSGATETIGFDKNPFSRLFTKRIPHKIGKGIHEIQRNQALIADLTDDKPERPALYPPPLGLLPNEGGETTEILPVRNGVRQSHSGIRHPASGIYYTISPASLWFTKQYPAERWAELIREMPEEATIYLLGSKKDHNLCEQIIRLSITPKSPAYLANKPEEELLPSRITRERAGEGRLMVVNLAGKITLLESAALIKGARMNFTNDSAPMHLASAVNAPVTVVYCSTTPDFGFGPLSDDSVVVEIREKLVCRPCGLHGRPKCPENHFRCALGIDAGLLRSRL